MNLKTCPNCGSGAKLIKHPLEKWEWKVRCSNSCYRADTGWSKKDIVEYRWNNIRKYEHRIEYRICVPGMGAVT